MRLALHLRLTVPALIVCMLLSGNVFAVIHPVAMVLTALVALVAFKLPRYRQEIEASYWIGLPLYCVFGAITGSSLQDVGENLALGLCGSVYGLTWFGLAPETPDPAWRRWTTAVPVLVLLGACIPIRPHGPGLGRLWIMHAVFASVVVVFVAVWRRPVNPTATWSFAAAVTLGIAIRTFQNPEQPNALDIALVFLPYAAGVVTTLASRSARLLHNSATAEPVGEQLRPLG